VAANEPFDVVILGGGMGGYVGAIRAAQLGMRTALIEEAKLGGTCLHWGCIPTKALLESAGLLEKLRRAGEFGITTGDVAFDYPVWAKRRDSIVGQLHKGVEGLMRKNKIEVVRGRGTLLAPGKIGVKSDAGDREVLGRNVLITTGSKARSLPGMDVDGTHILTSDHAVTSDRVPRSIAIVGAGAIGVEFATLYHAVGAEVWLIEALPRIVPLEDTDVSAELHRSFERRGIKVRVGARVERVEKTTNGVRLQVKAGGRNDTIDAEQLLVAVGRAPSVEGIGLETVGVAITPQRTIQVDEHMRTTAPAIYAAGDVIGGYLLAHVAAHEGIHAVEHMAGKNPEPMITDSVPRTTYCHPQIASMGLSEEQAKERGNTPKAVRFPLRANGRALIHGEPDGFAKVVADAKTGALLGMHIIGVEATELIATASLARLFQADAWEVGASIYPHPTLSEVIGEAALGIDGMTIHA
jgi:dihydrolipoamide dehydrogenase